MQITSINDIIQGELLNSPAISFIYNIKTKVKKVQEGDLFFAQNENDIQDAVNQGAFAIIVENNTEILDNEIAWIKVENIKKAIIKFIRYKFSQIELNAYCCDDISLQLFKTFSPNQSLQNNYLWLFEENLDEILSNINEIKDTHTIICSNENLLNSIYPNFKEFDTTIYNIENLVEHSLFETSFSYKNYYFSRIRLSSLFINQFLNVVNFFDFEIDLNRLKKTSLLKPIFIDKFFQTCEYGKSDKFVLIQEKIKLVKEELNFIYNKYKYGKTLIISKEKLDFSKFNYIIIKDQEDILIELKKHSFNAVYIIGYSKKEIEKLFENNNITTSLL